MRTQNILITLTMLGGLALAACAPSGAPNTTSLPLNGTSWLLATLNGKPALTETQVSLNFEADRLSGSDGCNRFNGGYEASDSKFSVGQNLASTMMACPEPIMQQAAAFTQALTKAGSYQNDGKQLTLLDADGKALAVFNAQSQSLEGASWIVTGYNNGKQAVVGVLSGSNLTASFGPDGKLSGSAGCNNYNASYKVSTNTIQIGPAATTRMMCSDPAGVMEQEMQFFKALETAAAYRIDGNFMELRTADDAMAATFERVP